jgi:hypothetical protein
MSGEIPMAIKEASVRFFRIGVAWSTLGVVSLIGTAGASRGQGGAGRPADAPIAEKRLRYGDFRTVLECLGRVSLDHGLTMRYGGGGSGWSCPGQRNGDTEEFVVMADDEGFPWLKGQQLADVRHPLAGAKPDTARPPEVILDLDTGRLTAPEGVGVKGWQIDNLQVGVDLMRPGTRETYHFDLERKYPDDHVEISIRRHGAEGEAGRRQLLAALESKLKLASKVKEMKAKKERRPAAQPKAQE